MCRMQMLEQAFLGFVNEHALFSRQQDVLLAVSGGLDSMVMAALCYRIGQSFAIAHVNYGLRGDASDADEQLVAQTADAYGVPFHRVSFDTYRRAGEAGVSVQMMARQLRYDWFAELMTAHAYTSVATAHHLNDVLETLLLNLTRGTGLAGLRGMAAARPLGKAGQLVRPLLFATRAQLEWFASQNQIAFRDDASNASDAYARNRLRHHVVPVLENLNPGFWQTLPRTLARLQGADDVLKHELSVSWQQMSHPQPDGTTCLYVPELEHLPQWAFRLGEWLRPLGFTADQLAGLLDALKTPTGQVFRSQTHWLRCERGQLLIGERTDEPQPFSVDIPKPKPESQIQTPYFQLTARLFQRPGTYSPNPNPAIACLDADTLRWPLTLRSWHLGDRFRPLGMKGHKLVSDMLNDQKVSSVERQKAAVLVSGEQLVWLAGYRIAHPYRITPQTQTILEITYTSSSTT